MDSKKNDEFGGGVLHRKHREGDAPPDESNTGESLSILRVASDLYPDVVGGFGIHVHSMSAQQAANGHDVTVLTTDHGEWSRPRQESRDGYMIVRHRELASPLNNSIAPGVGLSLRRRLSEADVVHAHSHLFFTSNLAALVSRLTETPLVVTNHGLVSQTAPGWVQKLFLPTVGRFTFNAADRVLCYTETDERRLRERNVDAQIEIVKNGVDCEQFAPDGPGSERRRLLFVGRLLDRKGVGTLLDAFERLAGTYPDLELCIVGDGPQRETYERRCESVGIDDRVEFVGSVPNSEMPRYYRTSQVFVLPSHNEGLPRTVLEAMATETPVVTTALPQLEDLVDGAGFTAEAKSVDGFVDAIGRLLEDDDARREMGRVGREQVLRNHSWSETVARTTQVCRDVVSEYR